MHSLVSHFTGVLVPYSNSFAGRGIRALEKRKTASLGSETANSRKLSPQPEWFRPRRTARQMVGVGYQVEVISSILAGVSRWCWTISTHSHDNVVRYSTSITSHYSGVKSAARLKSLDSGTGYGRYHALRARQPR